MQTDAIAWTFTPTSRCICIEPQLQVALQLWRRMTMSGGVSLSGLGSTLHLQLLEPRMCSPDLFCLKVKGLILMSDFLVLS